MGFIISTEYIIYLGVRIFKDTSKNVEINMLKLIERVEIDVNRWL